MSFTIHQAVELAAQDLPNALLQREGIVNIAYTFTGVINKNYDYKIVVSPNDDRMFFLSQDGNTIFQGRFASLLPLCGNSVSILDSAIDACLAKLDEKE